MWFTLAKNLFVAPAKARAQRRRETSLELPLGSRLRGNDELSAETPRMCFEPSSELNHAIVAMRQSMSKKVDDRVIIQEIPNPHIRDAADQFEKSRKLLAKQPPGSGLLLPRINMAAVAVELYLKCLSAERVYESTKDDDSIGGGVSRIWAKPALRGHILIPQLDKIDLSLRQDLENAFRSNYPSSPDFRDALGDCEGAFATSRYPFEGTDITRYSLGLLDNCAKFLAEFVEQLSPKIRTSAA